MILIIYEVEKRRFRDLSLDFFPLNCRLRKRMVFNNSRFHILWGDFLGMLPDLILYDY